MSDDIIFVLQTDSSLHCRECRQTFRSEVQQKLQLFEAPIEIFDIHQSNPGPASWAIATCKQRKDSILCQFHWIQIRS